MSNKKTNKQSAVQQPATIRKLSPWRVLLALVMLTAISYGTVFGIDWWQDARELEDKRPWFAAYVDVTATPSYAFEQLGSTSAPNAVLSFIVSDSQEPCTPTWGNYFTLDEAAESLDLDRRIARLQQQGGKVAVSFGGALNHELALYCTSDEQLLEAYQAVIDRYNIDTIDIDLENTSLTDTSAALRRSRVLANLQKARSDEGKKIAIWITLPVTPQGLTVEATNVIRDLLIKGVDIAGINIMTMDYGESKPEDQSMLEGSSSALRETHRQLGILYNQAGFRLSSAALWKKLGATPMIGQNDVASEVFSLEDATGLNQFALEHGVGRMSMWSANRDIPCGENYVATHIVSDSCSGVSDEKMSFAEALSDGFDGDIDQFENIDTIKIDKDIEEIVDNPSQSPYQIWEESVTYLKGTKVVWRRNVYESKWWTKGDLPDNPVLQSWETPWQLIGPVLPGEKPVVVPTLPPDIYPDWSGEKIYQGGERVMYDGIPFEAKWWNQGHSPAESSSGNFNDPPWQKVPQKEIEAILAEFDTSR